MIERDARDRGGGGARDDVGRVEASADADLHDGEVDPRLAEGEERRERRRLEEGEIRPGVERAREQLGEPRVAHRLAVDADALGEPAEVRRGVEARLHARRARDRLDHRADAALAVGPGDVHHAKAALGVPGALAGGAHRLEPEPHAERDAGVERGERVLKRRQKLSWENRKNSPCAMGDRGLMTKSPSCPPPWYQCTSWHPLACV